MNMCGQAVCTCAVTCVFIHTTNRLYLTHAHAWTHPTDPPPGDCNAFVPPKRRLRREAPHRRSQGVKHKRAVYDFVRISRTAAQMRAQGAKVVKAAMQYGIVFVTLVGRQRRKWRDLFPEQMHGIVRGHASSVYLRLSDCLLQSTTSFFQGRERRFLDGGSVWFALYIYVHMYSVLNWSV
jgi:hypothetical protein